MSELEELKSLYARRDALSQEEGRGWVERVSTLLHRLAPARAEEFDELTPYLFAGLSTQLVAPTWIRVGSTMRAAIAEVESSSAASPPETAADPKAVFVVHGRNEQIRQSLFAFLRAIGLSPIEWAQAIRSTGKASPYIGEILSSAFGRAQAVVVLLSPDDEVRLSESLWGDMEPPYERTIQMQARPNVLFEAGMAFGIHADRTVLVQVGHVKSFSDVAGRHVLLLDDSPQRRTDLSQRLETAGCPVDLTGRDWLTAGNFVIEDAALPGFLTAWGDSPIGAATPRADLDVRMGYLGRWREQQIVVHNHGSGVAEDVAILADGAPVSQHETWVSGQTLPSRLRPGEELGVKIALAMGSPERAEIVVKWRDEDGTERSVERAVQLI